MQRSRNRASTRNKEKGESLVTVAAFLWQPLSFILLLWRAHDCVWDGWTSSPLAHLHVLTLTLPPPAPLTPPIRKHQWSWPKSASRNAGEIRLSIPSYTAANFNFTQKKVEPCDCRCLLWHGATHTSIITWLWLWACGVKHSDFCQTPEICTLILLPFFLKLFYSIFKMASSM